MRPDLEHVLQRAVPGQEAAPHRLHEEHPVRSGGAAMWVACAAFRANGFSHSTCVPNSRHQTVSDSWRTWGDAT